MKRKIDINLLLIIILLSVGSILFGCLFIHSIHEYTRIGNIPKNHLQYEKLTFEKYEVVEVYTVGCVYEIYLHEYDQPFCVHPIVQKELNKEAINRLKNGDKLEIYYKNSTIKNSTVNYTLEICEMKDANNSYLAFEDYKSAKQNQEIVGLIIGPIFFLLESILLFIIIKNRGLPSMKKASK
mgnify:CR=1 FL=1